MSSVEKAAKLVTKLLRLTSAKKITWEMSDAPESLAKGSDDLFPAFFETEYRGKKIGIYEQRSQGYISEYDKFYWEENVRIGLFDYDDRLVWASQGPTPGLYNLFNLVREEASGMDDLLDELLDDGDDEG